MRSDRSRRQIAWPRPTAAPSRPIDQAPAYCHSAYSIRVTVSSWAQGRSRPAHVRVEQSVAVHTAAVAPARPVASCQGIHWTAIWSKLATVSGVQASRIYDPRSGSRAALRREHGRQWSGG